MNKKEYLERVQKCEIDVKKVEEIQKIYETEFLDNFKRIISMSEETIFLNEDRRVLSFAEIVDAETDLHIAFKDKGIIPIVDCGENDFIVYHFNDDFWSIFNIIDESVFKKKDVLSELL